MLRRRKYSGPSGNRIPVAQPEFLRLAYKRKGDINVYDIVGLTGCSRYLHVLVLPKDIQHRHGSDKA